MKLSLPTTINCHYKLFKVRQYYIYLTAFCHPKVIHVIHQTDLSTHPFSQL